MSKALGNVALDQLLYQKICPQEFIQKEISLGCRNDARKLDEMRKVNVQSNYIESADSSCIIKLGSTVITCGLRLEVCEPSVLKKDEGSFVLNFSFPHYFSSGTVASRTEESQYISSQLVEIYDRVIDKKSLICSGSDALVWCLYIDLLALNVDGSVLSACSIALSHSLSKLSIPSVQVNESGVVAMDFTSSKPLKMNCFPLNFSFGCFRIGNDSEIFADLIEFEELNLSSTVSLTIDCNGNAIQFVSNGNLTKEQIDKCFERAKEFYLRIVNIL